MPAEDFLGKMGWGFSTVMMSRILGNNPSPITQQGSVPITVGGRLNKKKCDIGVTLVFAMPLGWGNHFFVVQMSLVCLKYKDVNTI